MNAILIVEDNPSDLKLMQRALRKSNLSNDLATAIDGEIALDYLFGTDGDEYRHPLPVLVLLDLKLPKVDGLEVLEQIRKHERTQMLPVVILTSSKEQEDIVKSYRLGVNSYIRKPVDFNQFVEAVQHLGLYWLVLNESPFQ
ncbi:MAG: response regulator [Anaerolineae bacterium]|nr:response regulator [Anaerolineae bacterium]